MTPDCFAASSTFRCARWSIAHASLGTPVREAMHDTITSKASPPNASRTSDTLSVISTSLSVAPSKGRARSVGSIPRCIPAWGRTKQTTSWPCRTSAATVARPMVPVAPSTHTRHRKSGAVVAVCPVLVSVGACPDISVPLTISPSVWRRCRAYRAQQAAESSRLLPYARGSFRREGQATFPLSPDPVAPCQRRV